MDQSNSQSVSGSFLATIFEESVFEGLSNISDLSVTLPEKTLTDQEASPPSEKKADERETPPHILRKRYKMATDRNERLNSELEELTKLTTLERQMIWAEKNSALNKENKSLTDMIVSLNGCMLQASETILENDRNVRSLKELLEDQLNSDLAKETRNIVSNRFESLMSSNARVVELLKTVELPQRNSTDVNELDEQLEIVQTFKREQDEHLISLNAELLEKAEQIKSLSEKLEESQSLVNSLNEIVLSNRTSFLNEEVHRLLTLLNVRKVEMETVKACNYDLEMKIKEMEEALATCRSAQSDNLSLLDKISTLEMDKLDLMDECQSMVVDLEDFKRHASELASSRFFEHVEMEVQILPGIVEDFRRMTIQLAEDSFKLSPFLGRVTELIDRMMNALVPGYDSSDLDSLVVDVIEKYESELSEKAMKEDAMLTTFQDLVRMLKEVESFVPALSSFEDEVSMRVSFVGESLSTLDKQVKELFSKRIDCYEKQLNLREDRIKVLEEKLATAKLHIVDNYKILEKDLSYFKDIAMNASPDDRDAPLENQEINWTTLNGKIHDIMDELALTKEALIKAQEEKTQCEQRLLNEINALNNVISSRYDPDSTTLLSLDVTGINEFSEGELQELKLALCRANEEKARIVQEKEDLIAKLSDELSFIRNSFDPNCTGVMAVDVSGINSGTTEELKEIEASTQLDDLRASLELKQKQMQSTQDQMDQLVSQFDDLKALQASNEAELERFKALEKTNEAEMCRISEELKAKEDSISRLVGEKDDLVKSLERLNASNQSLEKEVEQHKTTEEMNIRLSEKIESLKESYEELKVQDEGLHSVLKIKDEEMKSLRDHINELTRVKDDLLSTIEALKSSKESDLQNAKEELEKYATSCSNLDAELTNHKRQTDSLSACLEQAKAEFQELELKLRDSEHLNSSLSQELAKITNESQDLKKLVEKQNSDIVRLTYESNLIQTQCESLKAKHDSLLLNHESLQQTLVDKEDRLVRSEGKLIEMTHTLEQVKAEANLFSEEQYRRLSSKLEEVEKEKAFIEEELAGCKVEVQERCCELASLTDELRGLKSLVEELNKSKEEASRSLEELDKFKSTANELRFQVTTLRAELNLLEVEKCELKCELETKSSAREVLMAENAARTEELSKVKKELAERCNQVVSLERALDDVNDRVSSLTTQLEEKTSALENWKQALALHKDQDVTDIDAFLEKSIWLGGLNDNQTAVNLEMEDPLVSTRDGSSTIGRGNEDGEEALPASEFGTPTASVFSDDVTPRAVARRLRLSAEPVSSSLVPAPYGAAELESGIMSIFNRWISAVNSDAQQETDADTLSPGEALKRLGDAVEDAVESRLFLLKKRPSSFHKEQRTIKSVVENMYNEFIDLTEEFESLKATLSKNEEQKHQLIESKDELSCRFDCLTKAVHSLVTFNGQVIDLSGVMGDSEVDILSALKGKIEEYNRNLSSALSQLSYDSSKYTAWEFLSLLPAERQLRDASEERILSLESQLVKSNDFKFKFIRELISLEPSLNENDLVSFAPEDLLKQMLSVIMEKEASVIENIQTDAQRTHAALKSQLAEMENELRSRQVELESAEVTKEELSRKVYRLEDEIQSLQQKGSMNETYTVCGPEETSLGEKLTRAMDALAQKDRECEILGSSLKGLEDELTDVKNERERLFETVSKLSEIEKNLVTSINDLEVDKVKLRDEIREKEAFIEKFQTEKSECDYHLLSLEKVMKDLKESCAEMEANLERKCQDINELKLQVAQHESSSAHLVESLAAKDSEINRINELLSQRKERIESLENHISEREKQETLFRSQAMENCVVPLQTSTLDSSAQTDLNSEDISRFSDTIARLESRCEALLSEKQNLESFKKQCHALQAKLMVEDERFSQIKKNLQEDLNFKTLKIKELDNQMKECEAQREREIRSMKSTADNLMHEIQLLKSKEKRFEEKLFSQRTVFIQEKATFEERLINSSRVIQALQEELRMFLEFVTSTLGAEIVSLDAARGAVVKLKEELDEEKKISKDLDTECEDMKNQILRMDANEVEFYERIEELEGANTTLANELKTVRGDLEHEKNQVVALKESLAQCKEKLSSAELNWERLLSTLKAEQKINSELALSLREKNEQLEECLSNLRTTRAELKHALNSIEDLQAAKTALYDDFCCSKNEAEALKQSLVSMKGETEAEMKSLRQTLEMDKSEIQRLRQTLETDESEIQRLRQALETDESEIQSLRSKMVELDKRLKDPNALQDVSNRVVDVHPSQPRSDSQRNLEIQELEKTVEKLSKDRVILKRLCRRRKDQAKFYESILKDRNIEIPPFHYEN